MLYKGNCLKSGSQINIAVTSLQTKIHRVSKKFFKAVKLFFSQRFDIKTDRILIRRSTNFEREIDKNFQLFSPNDLKNLEPKNLCIRSCNKDVRTIELREKNRKTFRSKICAFKTRIVSAATSIPMASFERWQQIFLLTPEKKLKTHDPNWRA